MAEFLCILFGAAVGYTVGIYCCFWLIVLLEGGKRD